MIHDKTEDLPVVMLISAATGRRKRKGRLMTAHHGKSRSRAGRHDNIKATDNEIRKAVVSEKLAESRQEVAVEGVTPYVREEGPLLRSYQQADARMKTVAWNSGIATALARVDAKSVVTTGRS